MFLRNGWYSAIWSHELKEKPVGKRFLNEKVVLFRNDRGEVGALEDSCCHRAAPLSLGEVSGATLVVPPLEEVFYRSFFYRYVTKADFQSVLELRLRPSHCVTCAVGLLIVVSSYKPALVSGTAL